MAWTWGTGRLVRRRRRERCPGCGRPLRSGEVTARDIGPDGRAARYHQRCAPSLTAVQRERVR